MADHRATVTLLAMAFSVWLGLAGPAGSDETPPSAAPQTGPPSTNAEPTATPPKTGTPTVVIDGQDLEGILGRDTLSRKGEKMGQIVNVLVDHNGDMRAAIIDFGGFLGVGSRKIAVDWRAVHFVAGAKSVRVVLDLTREDVLGSHEYKPGQDVTILEPAPPIAAPPK